MTRITALAIALLVLFLQAVFAAGPYSNAYTQITPVQPTQTENRIEVVEVFWYGCPHCYAFEPYVERWRSSISDDVQFRRLPAVLNQGWIPHARAYYTAVKLGVLDQIHSSLFDAPHRQKERLFSESALREFFVSHGIDGDEFTRVYNSTEVNIKIDQARRMAINYRIRGVPSMVVNGKYLTSGTMAGSYQRMITVVNHLVDEERQAQQ